ncbi:MAG: anthranilate/aminodeoxychorismate synthase component II [Verrucomicrobia bacterium]|nr:MAG: anthranilate/aminodeoxychorismate synthase component II [Verrucomicrobiota bacterium]
MILVIDNYDSFTYNLVHLMGELGAELHVVRNDEVTAEEAVGTDPERIVISPGPCTPREAGISCDVIRLAARRGIPVLGVCLGHQCVGAAFGGRVVRAGRLMHGKTSMIRHNGEYLFKGLPNPFEATRYHSLVVERDSLPAELEVTADSEDDGEIMGLRHRQLPVFGVQFHPESILTRAGRALMANFLELSGYSGTA